MSSDNYNRGVPTQCEETMEQFVKKFLERLERANALSDLVTIAALYADVFMFAGVNGVQTVKKEDFLQVVPRMKAHYALTGLSETQLQTVESSTIDARYLLAKAGWRMTVRKLSGDRRRIHTIATYILERKAPETFSIVFQIDHQDLAAILKNQQTT